MDLDLDPDPVDPLLDVFQDLDLYYLSKIQKNLRKKFIILLYLMFCMTTYFSNGHKMSRLQV